MNGINQCVKQCMAIGNMLIKQPHKSREYLKQISRIPWTNEFANEFENSWLLLADVYIQVMQIRGSRSFFPPLFHQKKVQYKLFFYFSTSLINFSSFPLLSSLFLFFWESREHSMIQLRI